MYFTGSKIQNVQQSLSSDAQSPCGKLPVSMSCSEPWFACLKHLRHPLIAVVQTSLFFFGTVEYSSAWMRQSWFSWMQGRRVIAGILETNDTVLWLHEWTVGAEAENCSPITWEVWAEGLSCTQYFTIAQKATMNVCTQILCEHKVSLL